MTRRISMSEEKKDGKNDTSEPQMINLKVVGQDGSIVHFKIKKHTPLRKLMSAYCTRHNLSMSLLRFRFDGHPINETDSADKLEMEEGDAIEVFQQQTGGFSTVYIFNQLSTFCMEIIEHAKLVT